MGINEQEALARQLYKIHEEALGTGKGEWELESPAWREAWIQVAQFVEGRDIETEDIAMYGSSRNTRTVVDDLMDKYPDHK